MASDLPWTISPGSIPPNPRKRRKSRKPDPTRRRKPRGPNQLDLNRPESITLQFAHNLNGTPYGPGRVTVPHVVAESLLNQEYHVRQGEERFRRDDIGVIIGGRTAQGSVKTYEVPGSTFDTEYGAAVPVERISGKGAMDPGAVGGSPQF